jgi:hypothetical protein
MLICEGSTDREAMVCSISVVRSQAPASTPPGKPEPAARAPVVEAARPVSTPLRKDALAQTAATAASVTARLAERDESQHPAAEARIAAEAAREAYIKASIAAGVSPLPLP